MSPSAGEVPGRFFATDFRLIRKRRQITLEDVARTTKIPVEIVDLFEQTGLLDHPRFNEVYLRSFVKQYAQAIGVPQRSAVAALEASLDERYTGSLAEEFLRAPSPDASPPSEAPPSEAPPSEAPPSEAPPSVASPSDISTRQARSPESARDAPIQAPTPIETSAAETESATTEAQRPDLSGEDGPSPPHSTPPPVAAPEDEEEHHYSIDALKKEAAYVPRARQPERRRKTAIAPPRFSPAVLIGLLVILLAVLAYFAWPLLSDRSPAPVPEEVVDDVDTGAVEVPPVVRLPDSVRVVVAAQGGPLSGIRVQIDEQESRRYWIEMSDSVVFRVQDRILLTAVSAMENVEVRVDGMPLPKDQEGQAGALTFDRNDFARLLGVAP